MSGVKEELSTSSQFPFTKNKTNSNCSQRNHIPVEVLGGPSRGVPK